MSPLPTHRHAIIFLNTSTTFPTLRTLRGASSFFVNTSPAPLSAPHNRPVGVPPVILSGGWAAVFRGHPLGVPFIPGCNLDPKVGTVFEPSFSLGLPKEYTEVIDGKAKPPIKGVRYFRYSRSTVITTFTRFCHGSDHHFKLSTTSGQKKDKNVNVIFCSMLTMVENQNDRIPCFTNPKTQKKI